MRAYLLDPAKRLITQIDYNDDWHSIPKHLDCELFDLVRLADGDGIYVDDEGLINGNPHGFFRVKGYRNEIFAGRGLVLGSDENGNTRPPKLKMTDLPGMIEFLDREEVLALIT